VYVLFFSFQPKGGVGRGTNAWRRKHRRLIHSPHICLKKVVMFEYRGSSRSEVNFATFFIMNMQKPGDSEIQWWS
jgi:hypothetical protein